MANYMAEVAKLLGVEIGEEFELVFPPPSTCHATVMLTTDGVRVINTDVYDVFNFKIYLLEHLLKGSYTIKRKPWKPKFGEGFWYVDFDGELVNSAFSFNSAYVLSLYKLGNYYRTSKEAEVNRDKWISFYTSDEVLEV
jgi:hypothetical protein